jgi:hypothetical protein
MFLTFKRISAAFLSLFSLSDPANSVKVGRLPRKTFSEIMLIEAKALAQIQSVDAILMSNDLCTIHTDGTKRKGREYGGLQIGTSSGQYSVGISELVQGTADSFFTMIKEIFNNLGEHGIIIFSLFKG